MSGHGASAGRKVDMAGLREAGHTNEIVDLYAIGFDPVIRPRDTPSWLTVFDSGANDARVRDARDVKQCGPC